MRVHHLNCGCMCPLGGALFDGFSHGLTARLACHCLLIESAQGLVLVDTGFGMQDMLRPTARLSPFFIAFNNIRFDPALTALRQIEALGFSSRDVRHIVLTHLDFDHAGGLEDFPDATVHIMQTEHEAAQMRRGFIASRRYRPQQWDTVKQWEFYHTRGDRWFDFDAVALRGLPNDILLVPLHGHTLGHAGIAVDTGSGWLLLAGDAYFYRREIGGPQRHCTPGLRFYQWMMEADRKARLMNLQRLRDFSTGHPDVRLVCSHDAREFAACATPTATR